MLNDAGESAIHWPYVDFVQVCFSTWYSKRAQILFPGVQRSLKALLQSCARRFHESNCQENSTARHVDALKAEIALWHPESFLSIRPSGEFGAVARVVGSRASLELLFLSGKMCAASLSV